MKFLIKQTISVNALGRTGQISPLPLVASDTCEVNTENCVSTIHHRYGISTLPFDRIQVHIEVGHLVEIE